MPKAKSVALWLLLQSAVLLAAATPLLVGQSPPDNALTLSAARVASGSGSTVALPDDWRQRAMTGRSAVYEFALSLEQPPTQNWAVLITSLRMRAELDLNGVRLLPLEKGGESATRMWFRPMLYAVAPGVLRDGANTLRVSLEAEPGRGYLAAPLVGSLATLAVVARKYEFWGPTLLTIIVVAMTAVGVFTLFLWTQRRRDSVYGLYGLGMLAWAAHDLSFLLGQPPLPAHAWDALSYLALGTFIAATMFFIHRYLDERHARLERAVVVFMVAGGALLFALPEHAFHVYSDYVWHPVVLSVGFYLYVRIYIAAWRRGDRTLHVLAMTGSIMVLYGAHDSLILLGLAPWGAGFLLPYSAVPSLAVFTSLVVRRFARSLDEIEATTADLDHRVREAMRELETNHLRLRDLERQSSLATERERVARDIHDGVGGQLVALLARVKRGQYSETEAQAALSQALQDLRLVIESLDVAEGDLGTALATWRHRLERRLAGSRVRLVWKPADVARLAGFGPSDILNVLRLLDEAATNVLRHAGACTLTVEYRMDAQDFSISLTDDGCGGAAENKHGHGMQNMYRRAAALGAALEIQSGAHGTSVRLRIPINSATVSDIPS